MVTRRARTRALGGFVSAAATVLASACGLVIDPDVLVSSNGTDSGVEGDGPIIDPNCKPAGQEVCDDGIDNDCNGLFDCADPACTSLFECVDAPPDGWTPIVLADTSRPTCPSTHSASTNVRVVEGTAHTCNCSCTASCGSITLATASDGTCAATSSLSNTNGACSGPSGNFSDLLSFGRVSASPPSCSPNNAVTTRPAITDGRTCVPPPAFGAGCASAQRCMPKAAGFLACVAKAGNDVCPASAFTKHKRAGTTSSDGRSCAGCACNAGSCNVELELWTQPQCMGTANAKLTSATNGTCAATTPVNGVKAYKASTTGGCSPSSPSTPQGAVTFQDEQTICCR